MPEYKITVYKNKENKNDLKCKEDILKYIQSLKPEDIKFASEYKYKKSYVETSGALYPVIDTNRFCELIPDFSKLDDSDE